jgi:hypothetical protein
MHEEAKPRDDANKNKNVKSKGKKTSVNQMEEQVKRGKAPKSVDRVDRGRSSHEKPHIHFKDGSALNEDGTWKEGKKNLTNEEKGWIEDNGWTLPK